jgi:putative NADH-flavin reductase
MSRIVVIGGTGYAGGAVVAEAVKRGHEVTGVGRSAPEEPIAGATYVAGSALDLDFLRDVVANADAVVASIPARGDMVDAFDEAVANVIQTAGAARARLVVIGGFSVLRPAADAPRFIESGVAEQYRVEAEAGWRFLQALQASPPSLDWVFVSPAAKFGAWTPGEATGTYRMGGEVAILDENGSSAISGPDLALAVLDLVESGEHGREHVSVVS